MKREQIERAIRDDLAVTNFEIVAGTFREIETERLPTRAKTVMDEAFIAAAKKAGDNLELPAVNYLKEKPINIRRIHAGKSAEEPLPMIKGVPNATRRANAEAKIEIAAYQEKLGNAWTRDPTDSHDSLRAKILKRWRRAAGDKRIRAFTEAMRPVVGVEVDEANTPEA